MSRAIEKIETFGYTNKYLTKNDKPWFPVMGEFHYSRYPKKYWKESLNKMKAGGVQVVSTYTIWIHHEEIENEYDFVGNKDLRKFVEEIKEAGLYLCLRIGPWVHAEVRNGGFPDWLLNKDFEVRTNDEEYFKTVEKFYIKLYEQVEGLFLEDGGPIIAVQIENEYGHCGGLTGEDGESHMIRLTKMAKNIGFDVPLYTATGWGGAMTGGLIPVMGGYCESPWDQRLTEIEPSGNYVFTYERNDHNIGSDYGFGHGITFDSDKFPYLTAELGGGLQVTRHRRPVATGKDIGAMSLVKLGSGCNLLGYYMYHGGTNPKGKLTTLNESRDSGYLNDLNELNYDFRTAIREYGQISDTFKEIKLLSLFVADYGEEICRMDTYIPESNPITPTNFTDLRHTFRHNGKWGFVFVNNYVRKKSMAEHKDVELGIKLDEVNHILPKFNVKNGDFMFYPINMPLHNGEKLTNTVTPLCKVNGIEIFYGVYEQIKKNNDIILITRDEALNCYKICWEEREQIIISNAPVIQNGNNIEFYANSDATFKVYPDFINKPKNLECIGKDELFTTYKYKYCGNKLTVDCIKTTETDYEINIKGIEKTDLLYDVYLDIDYTGESADIYINNEKVADEYYTGEIWQIGLRKFDFAKTLNLKLTELHKDEKIFLEDFPIFSGNSISKVNEIKAKIIEKNEIKF